MVQRRTTLLVMCVVSTLLAACTSGVVDLKVPDLFDQLSNKNLSPVPTPSSGDPHSEYSSNEHQSGGQERYPGDPAAVPRKRNFSGAAKTNDGFELNFNNVKLQELVKVILGDTLQLPYVYDPQLQGVVTLSTGRAVPREELIPILESILDMNRAALIKDGEIYRVIPSSQARLIGSNVIDYASEHKQAGPGYGVSVFPLRHVSADAMLKMLSTFVTKPNILRASANENILVVRGSGRERQSLLSVAMMFDVDWMRGQSAGIFTLRNSAPRDVITDLEKVFRNKNGRGKGIVRFKAISRLNAVLALSRTPDVIDQVAVWIDRLDRTGSEAEGFYVYRVEHGKAKDLADTLNKIFGGGDSSVRDAEEDKVAPDQSVSELSSSSSNNQIVTATSDASTAVNDITTASLTPSPLAQSQSSVGIRIIADETNNKLLIKASGRDYRQILGVLKRIDQPPLQVLINATLAEVRLNDNLEYGVQFFLQKKGGQSGTLGFSNGTDIVISPTVPGLNFIVGSLATPKVVLDALAVETSVRVVSSPSVVVVHNQTATLQVGDEIPIATRSSSSVTDPVAPIVNEIEFRDTGVILKVTPRVNSNGLVTMEIQQEISAVTTQTAVGDATTLTPTISQRKITSTIAVQSGQMVVLGGMISERMDNDKRRVPILRKVPILGDIVGDTNRGKERTELIVFLQPVVIRNSQDASMVAEALRAGLQSLAPKPLPIVDGTSGWVPETRYKK